MAEISTSQLINPANVFEAAEIREGMKVVDLGCGVTGHFIFPAARLVGPDGLVYAVDIQKFVLQAIQGRMVSSGLTNIKIIWGDIERPKGVSIADDTIDLALLINNLSLTKNRENIGREAFRILDSGGELVVIDWKLTRIPFGPLPENRVSAVLAKEAMEAVGFKFVREFEPGEYHYGLIFEKP